MKKLFCCWMVAVMLLLTVSPVSAEYKYVTETEQGVVIDIIDGDAVLVRLYSGGNALVRLIGVSAEGNDAAYQFLINYCMGKQVTIVPESYFSPDGRFGFGYIYLDADNSSLLNETLVAKGYAKADPNHSYSPLYNSISASENSAQASRVGIWDTGRTVGRYSSAGSYSYTGDMVNINTASYSQLMELLSGVNSTVAYNITNYRDNNPFNTVYELKFVEGMTKEIFNNNLHAITVSTDINEATEYELRTLADLTENEVDRIIDARTFSTLSHFYTKTDISRSKYDKYKDFIFIDEDDERILYLADPEYAVNINTASEKQLAKVNGVSDSLARQIVSHRSGYSYKTITELRYIDGSSLSTDNINKLEDNLRVYTDLNRASFDEIASLFGDSYIKSEVDEIISERPFKTTNEIVDIIGRSKLEEIEDYIYLDHRPDSDADRVNINTASSSQMAWLNLSTNNLQSIMDAQGNMTNSKDIPYRHTSIKEKVALYTNINTASRRELESLHPEMSGLVTAIMNYRDDQPFGSKDEIREFLRDQNRLDIYNSIEKFVVVR